MTRPRIYRDPDIDIDISTDNGSDTYNVLVVKQLISESHSYTVTANNRDDAMAAAKVLAERDTRPFSMRVERFEVVRAYAGDWAPADS